MNGVVTHRILTRLRITASNEYWPKFISIKFIFSTKNISDNNDKYPKTLTDLYKIEPNAQTIYFNYRSTHATKNQKYSDILIYCKPDTLDDCLDHAAVFAETTIGKEANYPTEETIENGFMKASATNSETKLEFDVIIKYDDQDKNKIKSVPESKEAKKIYNNENYCKENSVYIPKHEKDRNIKPFLCSCKNGYMGGLCDKNTSCIRCLGDCVDGNECEKCQSGWSGKYCESKTCSEFNMCQNGGTCKATDNKRTCDCPNYTDGDYCEILKCETCQGDACAETNDCQTCFYTDVTKHKEVCKHFTCSVFNLCQNNAYCHFENDHWKCDCLPGTGGTFCEQFIGNHEISSQQEFLVLTGKDGEKIKKKDGACLEKSECNIKDNVMWCKTSNNKWVFCEYIDTETFQASKTHFVALIIILLAVILGLSCLNKQRKTAYLTY